VYKSIEYEQIVAARNEDYILVDVRSPMEYEEATIPGAINIPLFTDEERREIGTIYNHVSVEDAKKLGVGIVGKKLPDIYEQISQLKHKQKNIVIFCARGGLRSSSLVSLFSTLGINIEKLKGGYKSYRRYIFEELPEINKEVKYVVLHGNTGVGKTHILTRLEELGYDILDLEKCANNRGSLLGSVGLGMSSSQKQFDGLIFNSLKYRKSDYVFVEAESKRIGNINIPDFVFSSMKNGIHIKVTADLDFRAELLIEEYTKNSNCDDEILSALDNLKKYIGEKNRERFNEMLLSKKYKELSIELMEKYYDPMYENQSNSYNYSFELKVQDIYKSVDIIIEWFENYKNSFE
jgi:tRNA 2-selenouridine synthase